MSIKQYYELETVLEAIDSSKEKFTNKPYLSADAENEEMLLVIDGFLATLMMELLRKKSEFVDLDKDEAVDEEKKVDEGGEAE